jgi:hypothetical protein
MGDDALSRSAEEAEHGWGGARQSRWRVDGKRAVVKVEPNAYAVAATLARLCNRPLLNFNVHVYRAGLAALMGVPIETICTGTMAVAPRTGGPTLAVARTDEEVRAVAQRITFTTEETRAPEA